MRLFEDPWGRIKQLDEKERLKLLDAETTEIAAVVLSKLDATKAAALLGTMPGPRAQDQLCHLTNGRRNAPSG